MPAEEAVDPEESPTATVISTRSIVGGGRDRPRLRLARGAARRSTSACSSATGRRPGRPGSRPGCWLRSASSSSASRSCSRLTLAPPRLYPDFAAELEAASGAPAGYRQLGALHVALDRDEAAELRRRPSSSSARSASTRSGCAPRRCRELEPGLTPSFNGGVHAPDEAAVDPRALSRVAAGRARRRRRRGATGDARSSRRCSRAERSPACGPRAGEELRGAARRARGGCLVGRGRVAARGRPPAGAPGQGPDPRAALRPTAPRPASGSSARERVYVVPAPRRPPDRRRHGRGARLRHDRHRRRRPRAAARGLPAAPRGRRAGAGRGGRRPAPRHPRQPAAGRARRGSRACSWRPATSATASCSRRSPPKRWPTSSPAARARPAVA